MLLIKKFLYSDDYGFVETRVERKVPVRGTDLWLECDYSTLGDTADVTATILGGLDLGSEHCLAVLTYTARLTLTGPVTSCSSQPSEYSLLYALDMYLATQVSGDKGTDDRHCESHFSRTMRSTLTTITELKRENLTHMRITLTTAPSGRGGRGKFISGEQTPS